MNQKESDSLVLPLAIQPNPKGRWKGQAPKDPCRT